MGATGAAQSRAIARSAAAGGGQECIPASGAARKATFFQWRRAGKSPIVRSESVSCLSMSMTLWPATANSSSWKFQTREATYCAAKLGHLGKQKSSGLWRYVALPPAATSRSADTLTACATTPRAAMTRRRDHVRPSRRDCRTRHSTRACMAVKTIRSAEKLAATMPEKVRLSTTRCAESANASFTITIARMLSRGTSTLAWMTPMTHCSGGGGSSATYRLCRLMSEWIPALQPAVQADGTPRNSRSKVFYPADRLLHAKWCAANVNAQQMIERQ